MNVESVMQVEMSRRLLDKQTGAQERGGSGYQHTDGWYKHWTG